MSVEATALAKRRAHEAQVRSSNAEYIKQTSKAHRQAEWEQRTTERIARTRCKHHAKLFAEQDEREAAQRRQQLEVLYESDMNQWKEMVEAVQVISREKQMEQIRERAYRLKEQREAERRAFVEECYRRRWREGNDETRTQDSIAIAHKTIEDRKNAINVVDEQSRDLTEKERYVRDSAERLKKYEQREKEEEKYHRLKNAEVTSALDMQVMYKKSEAECKENVRRQEEMEKRQQKTLSEEEERQKQEQARQEKYLHGREMLEANGKRQAECKAAKDIERQKDKVLLTYLLEKENKEVKNEKLKKEREKQMSIAFINDVQEDNTSEIDLIRKEATEKICQKRDEKVKAQEEARHRLNIDVQQARQLQIKERMERTEKEKQDLAAEAAFQEERLKAQEELERKSLDEFKRQTISNMEENKALIEQRRTDQLKNKQQTYLQHKEMIYEEKQYQEQLKRVAGNAAPRYSLKGTEWYS